MLVLGGETFPNDPSGMIALASAIRQHTTLQEFIWTDSMFMGAVATQGITIDPLLRALPACPHLREVTILTKCASADAIKSLLQVRPATTLCLVLQTTEHWLAVIDEVRLSRCHVKNLILAYGPNCKV